MIERNYLSIAIGKHILSFFLKGDGKMKQRKFIGRWVNYKINGNVRKAKVESISFSLILKKPVFHLISPFGNRFVLTKEELML